MSYFQKSPYSTVYNAFCIDCGAKVTVQVNPPANGIQIGGEAVALTCPIKPKIEIIRVDNDLILTECKDFAKLKWPKGATDYIGRRSNDDSGITIIIGKHIYGWTDDIKRKNVSGWSVCDALIPKGCIIWVKIKGKGIYDNTNLIYDILDKYNSITKRRIKQ